MEKNNSRTGNSSSRSSRNSRGNSRNSGGSSRNSGGNSRYSGNNSNEGGGYRGGGSSRGDGGYSRGGGGNSRGGRGGRGGRGSRGGSRRQSQEEIKREWYISKEIDTDVAPDVFVGGKFSDMNLNPVILKNILKKGYETATEIQHNVIPLIQEGKDVLGISATGSGKTAAFLIPTINKMVEDNTKNMLVLSPTRELATQIYKEAISLTHDTKVFTTLLMGGERFNQQISDLKRNPRIIIATPGRLMDMFDRGLIKGERYNNIVVDEVDKMMDMGFIDDVKEITAWLAKDRQSMFFSATLNKKVEGIISAMTPNFLTVKLAQNKPNTNVTRSVIDYKNLDEKFAKLQEILDKEEVKKVLVFVETKRFADDVDSFLFKNRYKVGVIHGDKRQQKRTRTIQRFKDSNIEILVATNVAARGIDIDDITHVINLDEPQNYDEYIHRIGRTGRNGKKGVAYTFVRR